MNDSWERQNRKIAIDDAVERLLVRQAQEQAIAAGRDPASASNAATWATPEQRARARVDVLRAMGDVTRSKLGLPATPRSSSTSTSTRSAPAASRDLRGARFVAGLLHRLGAADDADTKRWLVAAKPGEAHVTRNGTELLIKEDGSINVSRARGRHVETSSVVGTWQLKK